MKESNVVIEEVTVSDSGTLADLASRAILQSVEAAPAVKEEMIAGTEAHIEQGFSSADHIFLKYVDENVILGFILLKSAWNLCDLFVEPVAHNQGLGKALFHEALSIAVSRENRGYIRVNSSLNAEGFYRSLGFQSFTPEKRPPDFVVPLIYRLETKAL